MLINKLEQDGIIELKLSGRLDTVTAPELEKALNECKDRVTALTLNFSELGYVSSAGLRAILNMRKRMMEKRGSMRIIGVNESVMEVFEITGFADILTIE